MSKNQRQSTMPLGGRLMTQREWVLEHLKNGRTLTAKEAMDEYGIMQMGTRIFELRGQGHNIKSTMIEVENRYGETCHVAEYSLAPKATLF